MTVLIIIIPILWLVNALYLQGENAQWKKYVKAITATLEVILLIVAFGLRNSIYLFWVNYIIKEEVINLINKRGLFYGGNRTGDFFSPVLWWLFDFTYFFGVEINQRNYNRFQIGVKVIFLILSIVTTKQI